MDNQHKKITGYRDLSQSEIGGMNSIKALEADAGELFKQIGQIEGVDQRLLALAKTNLQQGFMCSCVRSLSQLTRSHEISHTVRSRLEGNAYLEEVLAVNVEGLLARNFH